MQATTIKRRLAAGELVTTFAIGRVMHPLMVEMFGLAGNYQAFWIDQEHALHSSDQMVTVAATARANGLDCFARVAPSGYWTVTQCLEAGFGGTMAAQIRDVEHAREFVGWTKFSPDGNRGLNVSGRDGDYTHKPIDQFVRDANAEQFVAIQIETLGALDDAEAIAALPGVDLLFVGPSDLSLSLGVPGAFGHPKFWEAIDQVSQACERHGKHWGAVIPSPEFLERALERGCRMPTIGNEVHAMRRGIAQMKASFHAGFPS